MLERERLPDFRIIFHTREGELTISIDWALRAGLPRPTKDPCAIHLTKDGKFCIVAKMPGGFCHVVDDSDRDLPLTALVNVLKHCASRGRAPTLISRAMQATENLDTVSFREYLEGLN